MQRQTVFPFRGGLDIVTPQMSKRDGVLLGTLNYEPDVRGYRRMIGYERFDGRPAPSAASYWQMDITNRPTDFMNVPDTFVVVGDVLTGATSGATATVAIDWAEVGFEEAVVGRMAVVTKVSGTFQIGEDLEVSSVKVAEVATLPVENDADTEALQQEYRAAAADVYRSDIAAPAGSGPIRGVTGYAGDVYCIRDNAGATAAVLYKATSSGWAAQSLGFRIPFTAGTAFFTEGETITGGTSTATAVVKRVVAKSGTDASNNLAGYVYVASVTGGPFQAAETITGGTSGATATAGSAEVANALPAGGQYEFIVQNFYGNVAGERLYGANGVGAAFEWDGTTLAFIYTGIDPESADTPRHVTEYRGHLWLGYTEGSWLFSALGNPLYWDASTAGAGEIATGDEVTGAVNAAGVLTLFGKKQVRYFQGQPGTNDAQLLPVSRDSGALPYTAQMVDEPLYMDGGAIRGLRQTDALGGWRMGSRSVQIEPLFEILRNQSVLPTCSMRVRDRDLYRVFFSDNTGISMYLGRETPEFGRFNTQVKATCAYSGTDAGDYERLFFGGQNGMVYEMDVGTSQDGEPIIAWGRTNYHHTGSPQVKKRWLSALVEADTAAYMTITFATDVDYGDPDRAPALDATGALAGGGFWDISTWDNFVWDAKVTGEIRTRINKVGRQCSFIWYHESASEPPHTLQMLTHYWSARGLSR